MTKAAASATPNTGDLRRELIAIEDAWKAENAERNRAFREAWAAKMRGIEPTEPPPVIQVTWSCGDPNVR